MALSIGGTIINEQTLPNEQDSYENELETIEIELLLEGIYRFYGFDFRNYSFPYIRRRIKHRLELEQLENISCLQEKVLHDSLAMKRLFQDFSISVTEMFRDPNFFLSLRKNVIPFFKDNSHIKIWLAGCSTGEESYSMAILLHEEGLLHKTRIYATDINDESLERAKEGIFPISCMQLYTRNYMNSGGKRAFSEYYTVEGDMVHFDPSLAKNIVFAQHNLVTDNSFNEFDVIICRNVMIYFNPILQKRVHNLLYESLHSTGFLGLGSKEGLASTPLAQCYESIDPGEKIYRKTKK